MSGRWLDPGERYEPHRKHRCDPPNLGAVSVSTGRQWECECGIIYEVRLESQHGESWHTWHKVFTPDPPDPGRSR